MIKLYQFSILIEVYPYHIMKRLEDIKLIHDTLKLREYKIPIGCEEPMQYRMRKNGFNLLTY